MGARKKVFIIHGKGLQDGLGKESGGDLDTVASNVFYAVWAQHHLKETLGRDPVHGQDYAFDFVNYSEGLFHLVVHRGCDIYLPDFPIDALAPRIKMLLITEPKAIKYLNEFTRLFTEYRRWMADYASLVSPELKSVSNQIFLQFAKVIEHQEAEAIKTGNNIIYVFYNLAYLDIVGKTTAAPPVAAAIREWSGRILRHMTGENLTHLREKLLSLMDTRPFEDVIDAVLGKNFAPAVERAHILALKQAVEETASTHGRIEYSEELLITAVEAAAFVVRGVRLPGTIPLSAIAPKLAGKISDDIESARKALRRYFEDILQIVDEAPPRGDEGIDTAVRNVRTCVQSLVEIMDKIQSPPGAQDPEGLVPIRLMIMYEASGIAVSNIEVVIRRLKGCGAFVLPDGTEESGPELCRRTDRDGAVEVFYKPATPGETCLFSATYDDMNYLYLPADSNPNVDTTSSYIEEGMEFADPGGIDRATRVSIDLIEREFKFLKDHDIHVAAIDDHHPYTPAILNKLQDLRERGFIGHIHLSSLPRGQEVPPEQLKCGADLIYEQYVEGRPWDNSGLGMLRHLAHCQDLALERIDLAMHLSRLIGSRHSKVEMVLKLAQGVHDEKSLEEIMPARGWGNSVASFEGKLALVISRTERVLGQIVLERPGEERPIRILAALSPQTDSRIGEPQINVAVASGHLLGRRNYPADYFFYCYGSNMMTMRNPNKEESGLDLSVLAQHLGSPADGGHSGAATCRPDQNPAFPRRLYSNVSDLNFLPYICYLGARIADSCGLRLADVSPPELELRPEQIAAIEKMRAGSIRLDLVRPSDKSDRLSIQIVKPPDKSAGADVSYIHVYHHARRSIDADYLIYCPPGLLSIVIHNIRDARRRLNPDRLAKVIGWSEDGGTDLVGIATGRLNKYIPKQMRFPNREDMFRLCELIGLMISNETGYAVSGTVPGRQEYLRGADI